MNIFREVQYWDGTLRQGVALGWAGTQSRCPIPVAAPAADMLICIYFKCCQYSDRRSFRQTGETDRRTQKFLKQRYYSSVIMCISITEHFALLHIIHRFRFAYGMGRIAGPSELFVCAGHICMYLCTLYMCPPSSQLSYVVSNTYICNFMLRT